MFYVVVEFVEMYKFRGSMVDVEKYYCFVLDGFMYVFGLNDKVIL